MIFRGARGGIFRNNVWYKVHWLKVLAKATKQGITTEASAHRFRHAHATALLAANDHG